MRLLPLLALALMGRTGFGQTKAEIHPDKLRIRVLSDSLVRLELKGPKGFEDRNTFVVQNRKWPGPKSWHVWKESGGGMGLDFGEYRVSVRLPARSLADVTVTTKGGQTVYRGTDSAPTPQFFPGPADDWASFVVADTPRIVPPPFGATPAPSGSPFFDTSGWDTTNQALDLYVFLNNGGGYKRFVKDYLMLTGKIELPPLFAFGLIDSRYHPYTQSEALEVIDKYRQRGFPLDMFVLDTDWRVGASKGYDVNTTLWPDLVGFIKEAHDRGVRTMFNDHPEPQTERALDSKETQYRWDGLTSLLKLGADVLWFDRNWVTHLREPAPGLKAEVWGERVYHDVTERFRPLQRPLIMSNVEGIDNGYRRSAPQPGFHRYPIHWTGDTLAEWPFLKLGIANAVNGGVQSLLPFISEDLTGHIGKPTTELYIRFMQFGCLSPITRLHCTKGETRFPWDFGEEAEGIVREFVKLRYRLLPTIYTAAQRACDDGTPVLRRCDLEYPQFREARDSQQYLLGDDILVAPVNESKDGQPHEVPSEFLHTKDGTPGLTAEYFDNAKLDGTPVLTRVDSGVNFDWGLASPDSKLPADKFSVRWTGVIGPAPETGDYAIGARTNDGAKLYIDGKIVVSKWALQEDVTNVKSFHLVQGKSYSVELDYFDDSGDALCHLVWIKPSEKRDVARRTFWLPPGSWVDPLSRQRYVGPSRMTVDVPLQGMPVFVREGGAVFLTQEVPSTSKGIWNTPAIDVFPPAGDGSFERSMYEDDGLSPRYLQGQSAKTTVSVKRIGDRLTIELSPAKGSYTSMPKNRPWTIRVNLPANVDAYDLTVDGKTTAGPWVGLAPLPRPGVVRTPFVLDSDRILQIPDSDVRKGHRVELTFRTATKG